MDLTKPSNVAEVMEKEADAQHPSSLLCGVLETGAYFMRKYAALETDRDAAQRQLVEVEAENARLKRGEFTPEEFQGLCHHRDERPGCKPAEFFQGCEDYQRKLFGHADRDAGWAAAEKLCESLWEIAKGFDADGYLYNRDEVLKVVAWFAAAKAKRNPEGADVTTWDYSFSVWPEERSPRWNWAAYALFKLLGQNRIAMDFTEKDFEEFRESLVKCGLTLREIERALHSEPERVH